MRKPLIWKLHLFIIQLVSQRFKAFYQLIQRKIPMVITTTNTLCQHHSSNPTVEVYSILLIEGFPIERSCRCNYLCIYKCPNPGWTVMITVNAFKSEVCKFNSNSQSQNNTQWIYAQWTLFILFHTQKFDSF